jgi:sialate O-acetylesterase
MKLQALLVLLVVTVNISCQVAEPKLELPTLICDNMVLQQQAEVKLWGTTNSKETVTVKTSWNVIVKGTADKEGNWIISIPTPKAGGPYTITISTIKKSITIQNVLIGEVWFCSGQSNMEMPLAGWPPNDTIEGSAKEIASANNFNIRFFIAKKALSAKVENNLSGKWEVCSPVTVAPSSATAYFFAKKLYEHLNIPIGLIESSWGGTPVESWISPNTLKQAGEFVGVLNDMEKSGPMLDEYLVWLRSLPAIDIANVAENMKYKNLDLKDSKCASSDFNDNGWPVMKLPVFWEQTPVGVFDGVIWFRKKMSIPENMVGKDLVLSLGPIDDMDCVWVNGQKIGGIEESGYWKNDRVYQVPADLIKNKDITIAIRVIDNSGGGGIYGTANQMQLSIKGDNNTGVSLAGEWLYLPVAEWVDNKFYVFNVESREFFSKVRPTPINQYMPTVLNNAMVQPAINYRIKGAIWYQGEANVGRAEQYKKIFPLMITNWRKDWNIGDFPFYFVQIAPWNYDNDLNATSSAELRDAQRLSLSVPNIGMAVTLDIGNNMNIHPTNKFDVGKRLALWALAKNYSEKITCSGPLYKAMIKEGNTIRIQFDYTDGGLIAKANKLKEFEIAGIDGIFIPAVAKIVNNEVVVSAEGIVDPVNVRYCWRNGSEASLFNGAGLPASGFITNNKN